MNSGALPLRIKIIYSFGMMGWSVLTNLIIVMVPYFYLPPENDDLKPLIPQLVWFGVINLLSVIISAGRVVDAFYDPFIAQLSDKTDRKSGRRIPFMRFFMLPAAVFCALVFFPPQEVESLTNAWWLSIVLIFFFISATGYIIPYNALIPEMAKTPEDKVDLSIYSQAGFVIGIIIAALCNNYSSWLQDATDISPRLSIMYVSIGLSILGCFFLAIPSFFIRERDWCTAKPSHVSLGKAIRHSFSIRNFRFYLVADLSFYIALSLISSGLVYYVTVLAGAEKELGGSLMGIMVVGSLLFFPVVRWIARKKGKKILVLSGLMIMSVVFLVLSGLGKLGGDPVVWLYIMVGLAAFPLAALGIIPTAILSEIAAKDGGGQEGVFFAVKYFFVKCGQTFGIALFALLTIYGIDPGDDLGLRLNGIAGAALCMGAFLIFRKFQDA